MPLLTRWLIRTALVYFVAALVTALALALRPVLNLPEFTRALTPVYFHLLMVGWVTQLIMGVVFWMFPKFTKENPRRSEPLGWATYTLLNGGLVLRVIGEPLLASTEGMLVAWLVVASAVMQWLAGMAFVLNTWARVKGR